ncbi:MAG: cytochrome b/b6 domain-containing protein [Chitinophagales bacterium]
MIEFYAAHKVLVWLAAILLPIIGCLLYYVSFGAHTVSAKGTTPGTLVRRFGVREWLSHWLMLLGFLTLATTGFMQVVPGAELEPLGPFHGWLGFIIFLISLITLLIWLPDALFRRYDWLWLQKMGGYLSHNPKSLPAGRFNAGQKIYYWSLLVVLIGLLVSAIIMEHGSHTLIGRRELFWCIHGLLGCLATVMVIGHGFLSLFVNPDTARVLWSGRVGKAYTDKYHSLWKAQQ